MFSTIHISSSNIKLMAVKHNSIVKYGVRPLEPGLVRDGRILDTPKVGEAIESLLYSTSVPKNNVIVSVSGLPYTYRVMDFPQMKPELVQEAMSNNLQTEFTVPLDSLYISWAPVSIKQESVEYFVIAVDRQFVDTIIETIKFAGITDWSLDIRPLALARAAARTDAIVVSLDYDYMDMVLIQGGQVKDMHSANVDMDVDSASRGKYFNVFASELSKLISYHSNTKNVESWDNNIPVILAGEALALFQETAEKEEILEELRSATGYPVEFLETWIPYREPFQESTYATNIGLALRRLKKKSKTRSGFHDINLDLLRQMYNKKPQTLSLSYILLPAMLVMIIATLVAVVGAKNQNNADIAALQTQLTVVNKKLLTVRTALTEENKIREKIDALTAYLQTSKSEYDLLLGNKGKTTPALTRVTSALPPAADFERIAIDADQISIVGSAKDSFDIVAYIRSLENAGYNKLNIQYIGDPEDETGYPFTVVINNSASFNGQPAASGK
jgi:Tfp pilus assembly protein PilN